MKPKTLKVLYWVFTILVGLMMLMDGIGGLMQAEEGKVGLAHLGYPVYLMTIFGVAKLLGVVAIVQNKFTTVKEWAYAGFSFTFMGAAASHGLAGDGIGMILMPLVGLVILAIPYFFWKKLGISAAAQGAAA
jgi:hypothetical protein